MNGAFQGLAALSNPIATFLKWVMIAGIAYTLATLALFFLGDSQESATNVNAAPTSGQDTTQQPVDIGVIMNRHLFGEANQEAVVDDKPLETTRLPLELQAVFASISEDNEEEAAKASTAIIAQKGKGGLLYRIDDDVPGGAKLVEVHTDHVVLSRGGVRERLNFPRKLEQFTVQDNNASPAPTAPQPPAQQPRNANPPTPNRAAATADAADGAPSARQLVEQYQAQIESDPEGTLKELGVEQAEGGGYRIGSLAQSPYLSQTGLRAGDVILSINGRELGNVQQDSLEIANVLSEGQARIEVQRGTRRFFVTTSLQ